MRKLFRRSGFAAAIALMVVSSVSAQAHTLTKQLQVNAVSKDGVGGPVNQNASSSAQWNGVFTNHDSRPMTITVSWNFNYRLFADTTPPTVAQGERVEDVSREIELWLYEPFISVSGYGVGGDVFREYNPGPSQVNEAGQFGSSFLIGELAPGASVDIHMDMSAYAQALGPHWLVCRSPDPSNYDDCSYRTGSSEAQVWALANVSVIGAVPEPATWALMSLGMAGLAFGARRRRG